MPAWLIWCLLVSLAASTARPPPWLAYPAAPDPLQPPPDAPPPDAPPAAAGQPAPPAAPPAPPWKSRLDLGFTGSAGVTQETSLRLAFTTEQVTETHRYKFDTSYYLHTAQGDRTDNNATAGILGEWPFPDSRWGTFAQGRYDFDEFQSWEHRITAGGGVTYQFIDKNKVDAAGASTDYLDLIGKLGVGARKEIGSLDEDVKPEGIAGLEFRWFMTQRQRLTAETTFFPNLEEFEDYRIVTKGEWIYKLEDVMDGLNLVAGVAHEYQAQTDPGVDHNDLKVYLSLALEF